MPSPLLQTSVRPREAASAPRRSPMPSGQWWSAAPTLLRKPYAVLAFPPGTSVEDVVGLATSAICSASGWQPVADGDDGWYAWRRGVGPLVTLVVAGYLPVIVAVAPGAPAGAATPAGTRRLLPGRAAASAHVRFIRAARRRDARVVSVAALPDLVAQSTARWDHWNAINHRIAEITEKERARVCPCCGAGCQPVARWCTRCEYEFGQGDDHARDRAVLEGHRDVDELRRAQAQFAAQAFPPMPAFGVPGPPIQDRGGRR